VCHRPKPTLFFDQIPVLSQEMDGCHNSAQVLVEIDN
jgi:hypothetical protein